MKSKKQKISAQAKQLLEYLLINKVVTTLFCRDQLSMMNPSSRISELRAQGWPIERSYYQQIDALGIMHRAAQYYLQEEKLTPEQLNFLN